MTEIVDVWGNGSKVVCARTEDSVVLTDFAQLLAIPLRDGCDLMDIIGQRLRAEVSTTEETPASQS